MKEELESEALVLDVWLDFLCSTPAFEESDFERLCAEHAEIAEELRRLRSRDAHRPVGSSSPGEAEKSIEERLRRLAEPVRRGARFSRKDVIARGGMGVIHRVQDVELDRTLALKEMILGPAAQHALQTARFLEEAQITAQLDHPGIVPIHEVGLNEEGRLYFAMKLVQGHDLRTILELAREGRDDWTQVRILGVLLKVCDAMAYAHSKGVIHRDLKPGNVMVGHFGEVYVMDWGLARAMGRQDVHDIRLKCPDASASLYTERREEREETPDSPLVTMDGIVVGTPAYMPPEQARGEIQLLSPRSDVYSLGAMLYHLLTGQTPYVPPASRVSKHTVLARVIDGSPRPVQELNRDAPLELVAICEKAMQREPRARYADTRELAEDLRSYLEGRVVRAYETGGWAEARKWVQRNRALAAACGAAVIALIAGLVSSLVLKSHSETNERHALENAAMARREKERADREAEAATKKTGEVLGLSALQDMEDLVAMADELWPAHPENIRAFEDWIQQARKLVVDLSFYRDRRAELRAKALPRSAEEGRAEREKHPDYPRWVWLEREVERALEAGATATSAEDIRLSDERLAAFEEERDQLETRIDVRRDWRFTEEEREARWWNNQLTKLIEGLETLERGLLAEEGTNEDHGWSLPKRLAFARSLEVGFGRDGERARAWSEALPEIRSAYPGLALQPQMGLVPIGPDPESNLWEFAHLQSGEPAVRGADGKLVLTEATGLVLVLLRGGAFHMGAQRSNPGWPNYDPQARDLEEVHRVELSPFFLSKYEMTQSQWLRLTGRNPSFFHPFSDFGDVVKSLLHPVEKVSWPACLEGCKRMGLSLPSEAQWEYGARGGTGSAWWTGNEKESLLGAVNLADQTAARRRAPWAWIADWPELDDGFFLHAPVNTLRANAFGLHHVHGNVWELCLDGYSEVFYRQRPTPDPVADPAGFSDRVARGGCFNQSALWARSAFRNHIPVDSADDSLGLRPARAIAP